jgi:hypothetical protein
MEAISSRPIGTFFRFFTKKENQATAKTLPERD